MKKYFVPRGSLVYVYENKDAAWRERDWFIEACSEFDIILTDQAYVFSREGSDRRVFKVMDKKYKKEYWISVTDDDLKEVDEYDSRWKM